MDFEPCTAETTSLYIVDDGDTAEIEHPCGRDEGHTGAHHCMFCKAEWNAEVTC